MVTDVVGGACVSVSTVTSFAGPSVAELRRAWNDVASGRYATDLLPPPNPAAAPEPTEASEARVGVVWSPAEPVVAVVGAQAQCGATTVALAIAHAQETTRVVELAGPNTSGLVAAASAELGQTSGWLRGQRPGVVLERPASDVAEGVPLAPDRMVARTVVDLGTWPVPGDPGWARDLLGRGPVVVAVRATVPGLRRLEVVLAGLDLSRCVVAGLGPVPRRWPKRLRSALGTTGAEVVERGRWASVPADRGLEICGVTGEDLPRAVTQAGSTVLRLVDEVVEGQS